MHTVAIYFNGGPSVTLNCSRDRETAEKVLSDLQSLGGEQYYRSDVDGSTIVIRGAHITHIIHSWKT